LPLTEEEPIRPNNGYGAQKAGGEHYLSGLAHRFDITAASLRIPGCTDYAHSDWLHYAFRRSSDRDVSEMGSWLDARDCARAFEACVAWTGDPPWQGAQAFNVSADEAWHRPEDACIVDRLAEQYPSYPPPPAGHPTHATLLDAGKLKRMTGWQPEVDMRSLWKLAGVEVDDATRRR
jgi:nucleoside-diphosphate-sugar epimerase